MSKYQEIQQDFLGIDMATRGEKWQFAQARMAPEEKRDVFVYCKTIAKMPYSVITRLIWRRILNNYHRMPQARHEVVEYIPVIRKQRRSGDKGRF